MAGESITYYRWNDDGAIHQIELRQQDNGRAVAYIAADDSEPFSETRQNIRSAIRLKGWGTLSDHRDGKFVLRVTGLDNASELLGMLEREGFTHGKTTVYEREAIPKKESVGGWIKSNSLRASGILASIGNALYFASAVHRQQFENRKPIGERKNHIGQLGTAVFFTVGDALLPFFGKEDDSRQLTSLLKQLKEHYVKENIEVPVNATLRVETDTSRETRGDRVKDWLHRHVNHIKCFSEAIAGIFYIRAGSKSEQNNPQKQLAGAIFGTGFLLAGLIPEKKIDPEKYAAAGSFGRLWMRIQSNPLTLGGTSGYSNTILTFWGANKERKMELGLPTGQRTGMYKYDYVIPTVMAGANGLYAISKKTTGGSIKEYDIVSDVYSIAAQILNKQPEDQRERAVESTAKFLGERPEIRDDHAQILIRLAQEMDIQRKNPWFERIGLPPHHIPTGHHDAPVAPQVEQPVSAHPAPTPPHSTTPITVQPAPIPTAVNDNPPVAHNDNPSPLNIVETHGAHLAAGQEFVAQR